ncbi:MAG TPA: hypothetical protein VFX58_07760 [Chitinophagaceae bacterium]|nr:hypothetical protein [Chitinophagaceae bacterium]
MKSILLPIFYFMIMVQQVAAQNVGIGTPTPQEKLVVDGGVTIGYTSSSFSQGTIRSTGSDLEYNTGFAWKGLVNYTSMSELSSLNPLMTTTRNAWVQVPGVSLTITTPGTYLIIFKIRGYSNGVYSLGGAYWDHAGQAEFRMNGNSILKRPISFIVPEYSYQGVATNRIDYFESPVENTSIQNISASTTFTIYARMSSTGNPPDQWVVDEAQILAIRLN